jgi:hypothetical protein
VIRVFVLVCLSKKQTLLLCSFRIYRMQSHHLLVLISDVLDISKIEANKLVIENIPCDIAEICEVSATLLLMCVFFLCVCAFAFVWSCLYSKIERTRLSSKTFRAIS